MHMHCVGCGAQLVKLEKGAMVAIACGFCGALAPVLITEGRKQFAFPASFYSLSMVPGANPGDGTPHIEYYLGYSDHQSDEKDRLVAILETAGLVSQRDCSSDAGCPAAFEKGVGMWKHREEFAPEP